MHTCSIAGCVRVRVVAINLIDVGTGGDLVGIWAASTWNIIGAAMRIVNGAAGTAMVVALGAAMLALLL